MDQKINLVSLSNAIQAYQNNINAKVQTENTRHWANFWFETIDHANKLLPYGSGIDDEIYFELAECTANTLVRDTDGIKEYFYDIFYSLFDCPTISQWQEQRKLQTTK